MASPPQHSELPFHEAAGGDKAAADRLFASLYDDLKSVAGRQIWHREQNPTVGPTAAVNLLYEKWIRSGRVTAQNRAEFLVAAAVAIQRIVIDHYRRKRVRNRNRVSAEPNDFLVDLSAGRGPEVDQEAVRAALDALQQENPRQYRAAMMRYYDGLAVQVIAEAFGLSTKQVQRDLRAAEAFVQAHLTRRAGIA